MDVYAWVGQGDLFVGKRGGGENQPRMDTDEHGWEEEEPLTTKGHEMAKKEEEEEGEEEAATTDGHG